MSGESSQFLLGLVAWKGHIELTNRCEFDQFDVMVSKAQFFLDASLLALFLGSNFHSLGLLTQMF